VEIGVLSSLAGSRISNWVWVPFTLVTFIQIIGNIFYSYVRIPLTDPLFKSWVELSDPFFNFIGLGTDGDLIVHKRIVATLLGAFVPLMSIMFFQFFIRSIRKPVVAPAPPAPEIPASVIKSEPIVQTAPEQIVVNPEIIDLIKNLDIPTPAEEIIANMANIPQEKLTEPYGTVNEQTGEFDLSNNMIPMQTDYHFPSPDHSKPAPMIETLPEPEATTLEELPEISNDYQPKITELSDAAKLEAYRENLVKKWRDLGLLEGLTNPTEESPIVQFLRSEPQQVINEQVPPIAEEPMATLSETPKIEKVILPEPEKIVLPEPETVILPEPEVVVQKEPEVVIPNALEPRDRIIVYEDEKKK
jgi:hypothetical protein